MHKIIHGNCIEELKKFASESVDLVLTDPPYGNDQGYCLDRRRIVGDEHPLIGLLALSEAYRVLRRNRCCFFFLDAKHLAFVDTFVRRYTSYRLRSYCVWDKRRLGLGYGIRPQHEMVLALEKGKPQYSGSGFGNVFRHTRALTNPEHPHKKPIEILSPLIALTTVAGDIVLDPFAGSGSTGVAAFQLGRHFIGIECAYKYVQVARARLARAQSSQDDLSELRDAA